MTMYPKAVVINGHVYLGGGASSSPEEECIVMVYNIARDVWKELPPHEYLRFGMTAHNLQLVLVGGIHERTEERSKLLSVWNNQLKQWTYPYPPMKKESSACSAISHQHYIIVAGGYDGRDYLTRVEIINTTTMQWYETAPLPQPCACMSSCVVGNVLYLLGGWCRSPRSPNTKAFSTTFDQIISPNTGSNTWMLLTDPPAILSTAFAWHDSLISFGGLFEKALYAYESSTKSWVKVGEVPEEINRCACVVLPNGKVFAAGGNVRDHSVFAMSNYVHIYSNH